MSREPKYDLDPEAAVGEMHEILADLRAAEDREELTDIDSDTAFELGYESALFDYRRLTGPDPVELGIIIYTKAETDAD